MSIFDIFSKNVFSKQKTSAQMAKDRLRIIVESGQDYANPEVEKLKSMILDLIAKHVANIESLLARSPRRPRCTLLSVTAMCWYTETLPRWPHLLVCHKGTTRGMHNRIPLARLG